MKKFNSWLITACLVCLSAQAQEIKQAQVMIMGTFHFANPGADVVKTQQINVMTPPNQTYLDDLTSQIAENFEPTHVLLECDPAKQMERDARFTAYQNGEFELLSNEDYQLGFRIALKSHAKVMCYDEREIGWDAEGLMAWLEKENGPIKADFEQTIQSLTDETAHMHQTLSLQQLLLASNQPDRDQQNKALYIRLNDVGSGNKFEGADAAASWWHRNFRMYANIQRHAQPGTRVFVLGGQGHTAILKDLLATDPLRQSQCVLPLLTPEHD